jgi:MoaA/NifB/PqqE/SkfB family radical SAM enzyme
MGYVDYKQKLLGHLDRLAALKVGQVPPPVNAEIDLSMRCNLGCNFCHFGHTHSKGPLSKHQMVNVGDLMDMSMALDLVRGLAEIGCLSITWTGGGEPMLHPGIRGIMRHAADAGLHQGIYTNGTLIDGHKAAWLNRWCDWVYVSLDAADGQEYREIKGVGGFQAACDGVRQLSELGGTVGVGFMVTEHNARRLRPMAELAKALGASYVQFRPAILFDPADPATPIGDRSWALGGLVPPDGWPEIRVELDMNRFKDYAHWAGHGYDACYWSALQTVITADGRVWTCCNKRGTPGNCLGDLRYEPFPEIWKRRHVAPVDGQCRVLCRGHLPNKAIHELFQPHPHSQFI